MSAMTYSTASSWNQVPGPQVPENTIPFDQFKVGMHLKFRCGCMGFIESISGEVILNQDKFFKFIPTYTSAMCMGMGDLKAHYEEDTLPTPSHVFYPEFSSFLPATLDAAPEWYPSMDKPPGRSIVKKCIGVKIPACPFFPKMSFMIPGAYVDGDIFVLSNILRSVFAQFVEKSELKVEIGIIEKEAEINKETFKEMIALPPMSQEDVNATALHDWIVMKIRISVPGSMIDAGHSTLPEKRIIWAILAAKKNPLWKGQIIRVVMDDKVIMLNENGELNVPQEVS